MLGAAVVDDILALILLSVAVGMAADGGVDAGKIALSLAVAIAFVAFVALGGTRLLQRRPQLLDAPRFADSPLLPAVILCLGLAAFSAQIGLAALIGAFLAGMIVAETKDQSPIEEEVKPLYAFFPPFFFAFIGIELDLDSLFSAEALLLLAAVTALAVVTKLIPAYLARARPRPRAKPRSSASAWSRAARSASSSPRSGPPRASSTPSCSGSWSGCRS